MLSAYNVYWISGPSQSGTTSLAVILAKRIISYRKKAYFISMHKLVERSKDFDDKGYLDDLLRNDVIVLDDAFSGDRFFLKTEFVKAQFYNFLKEVIAQDKILICASNVKVNDISTTEYNAIRGLLTANTFEINVTGNLSEAVANEKKKKFEELTALDS
jgi:DNA replication protein DnaC